MRSHTHMPQMQMQIRRDKHGIHNWDAQACTRLLDSLLCITCVCSKTMHSPFLNYVIRVALH